MGSNASSGIAITSSDGEMNANFAVSGTSSSQGAGNGEGGDPLSGAPHRLSVDARVVQVEAEEREGPTQWRPPSPNAPPAAAPPAVAAAPGAPASAAPVGAGPDLNSVPWDLAGSVRQYFTPDTSNSSAAAPAAPATAAK